MSPCYRSPIRLRCSRWLLLLVVLLVSGSVCPSYAQTSSVKVTASNLPALSILSSSTGIIQFDNRNLFTVLTYGNEDAQDRAELANVRLAEALTKLHSQAASDRIPVVTVSSRDGEPILLLDGQPLLTVTLSDSTKAGQLPENLASTWAQKINAAIAMAKTEYEPHYLQHALKIAGLLLLVGLLLHGIALLAARRLHVNLGWTIPILIWFFVVASILDLFPQLRPIVNLFTSGPLRIISVIVLIALPTATLVRIWKFIIQRIVPPIPERSFGTEMTDRKQILRATRARVLEVTVVVLLWIVAALTGLAAYGVNISLLLTSAGLLGVALGLVLQDAIKDIVAGLYILTDDRFGVGDTVQIGNYQGHVERFTLSATQLRDLAGRLITISNRSIVDVANLTAHWGQVDFKVGVSYYDDLNKAADILKATADELYKQWPDYVLGPPEYLGADSFEPTNIILRLTIRTRPGLRDMVARELRARVKKAYDEAHIAMLNGLYTAPPLPADKLPTQNTVPIDPPPDAQKTDESQKITEL